jgi:hypothetical protein
MALQRSALWAVALAAIAIVLPAPARADHGGPVLDDALATYFGLAQAHWGGPLPTCVANGVTLIPVHAVFYDDPDPSVAAKAEQPGCKLWLDRELWHEMRPVEACTIVLHEWGHLLGYGHVANPLALMAEFPTRAPSECAALKPAVRLARASGRRRPVCAARTTRVRRALRKRIRVRKIACVRPTNR